MLVRRSFAADRAGARAERGDVAGARVLRRSRVDGGKGDYRANRESRRNYLLDHWGRAGSAGAAHVLSNGSLAFPEVTSGTTGISKFFQSSFIDRHDADCDAYQVSSSGRNDGNKLARVSLVKSQTRSQSQ